MPPHPRWVLGAARVLLIAALALALVTDGATVAPLIPAGLLVLWLAVAWVISSQRWARDYEWMQGLSPAQAYWYIGWPVATRATRPVHERPARVVAIALALAIGGGLAFIGVGVQTGLLPG